MTAAVDSSAVAGWAQSPDITAALLTVLSTGAPPHGDVVVVSIGGQGSGDAAALPLLLDRLLTTPQTVIANPHLDREGDGR